MREERRERSRGTQGGRSCEARVGALFVSCARILHSIQDWVDVLFCDADL